MILITEDAGTNRELDIMNLQRVPNARTYHHLRTASGRYLRPHKLVRSAKLMDATQGDLRQLSALGVSVIVDLRQPDEVADAPDVDWDGVQRVKAPLWVSDFPDDTPGLMDFVSHHPGTPGMVAHGYHDVVANPQQQAAMRQFLVTATRTPGAIMFHCSAGKDRTGLAAALLLGALGVSRADVTRDYLYSNVEQAPVINKIVTRFRHLGATSQMLADMRKLIGVDVDYLNQALDWVDDQYGSSRQYVGELLGNGADGLAALDHAFLLDEDNAAGTDSPR